jgi:elongin-A
MDAPSKPRPKSLVHMTTNVLLKNITDVYGLGMLNADNHAVKRILSRVTNPGQLGQIEENSPNLQGQLSKYWLTLIRRDFPMETKRDDPQPDETANWFYIYEHYRTEKEEEMQRAMTQLGRAFNTIAKSEQRNRTTIVGGARTNLPKPPRESRAIGMVKRGPTKQVDRSTLAFTAGSRTKHPFKKVMRQAKDHSLKMRSLGNRVGIDTTRTQLRVAPKGMVAQARVEAQHRSVELPPLPSMKRKAERVEDPSDDEDDNEDDNEDDLFDGAQAPKRQKVPSPSIRTPKKVGMLPGKLGSTAYAKTGVSQRVSAKSPSMSSNASLSTPGAAMSTRKSAVSPPQEAGPRKPAPAGRPRPKQPSIFMTRRSGRP